MCGIYTVQVTQKHQPEVSLEAAHSVNRHCKSDGVSGGKDMTRKNQQRPFADSTQDVTIQPLQPATPFTVDLSFPASQTVTISAILICIITNR